MMQLKINPKALLELRELFIESPERSVAEIRDHWGITRKHAIPLLEFCDKSAITVRNGDARIQGRGMPARSEPETAEPQLWQKLKN